MVGTPRAAAPYGHGEKLVDPIIERFPASAAHGRPPTTYYVHLWQLSICHRLCVLHAAACRRHLAGARRHRRKSAGGRDGTSRPAGRASRTATRRPLGWVRASASTTSSHSDGGRACRSRHPAPTSLIASFARGHGCQGSGSRRMGSYSERIPGGIIVCGVVGAWFGPCCRSHPRPSTQP